MRRCCHCGHYGHPKTHCQPRRKTNLSKDFRIAHEDQPGRRIRRDRCYRYTRLATKRASGSSCSFLVNSMIPSAAHFLRSPRTESAAMRLYPMSGETYQEVVQSIATGEGFKSHKTWSMHYGDSAARRKGGSYGQIQYASTKTILPKESPKYAKWGVSMKRQREYLCGLEMKKVSIFMISFVSSKGSRQRYTTIQKTTPFAVSSIVRSIPFGKASGTFCVVLGSSAYGLFKRSALQLMRFSTTTQKFCGGQILW